MHKMCRSDRTPEQQDTMRKTKESCAIITANECIEATEGGAVYVRDLDTRYSYEWKENNHPHYIITCKSGSVAPIVAL